jgi:hypothetical protein
MTAWLLAAPQPLQVFDRMAATGKLELPAELLITLSTLENVVTSPYLTAEPSSRGGMISPRGGLISPRGGAHMASPPSLACSPALGQAQGSSNGSQRASSPGRSTSPNRVSCWMEALHPSRNHVTAILLVPDAQRCRHSRAIDPYGCANLEGY